MCLCMRWFMYVLMCVVSLTYVFVCLFIYSLVHLVCINLFCVAYSCLSFVDRFNDSSIYDICSFTYVSMHLFMSLLVWVCVCVWQRQRGHLHGIIDIPMNGMAATSATSSMYRWTRWHVDEVIVIRGADIHTFLDELSCRQTCIGSSFWWRRAVWSLTFEKRVSKLVFLCNGLL